MTSVEFLADGKGLYGFKVSGHSSVDCDDSLGSLVCSAVSSACYMAANTVIEIVGDRCETVIDDAVMEVTVINPSDVSRTVIEGLKLHLTELSKQYKNKLKFITEV